MFRVCRVRASHRPHPPHHTTPPGTQSLLPKQPLPCLPYGVPTATPTKRPRKHPPVFHSPEELQASAFPRKRSPSKSRLARSASLSPFRPFTAPIISSPTPGGARSLAKGTSKFAQTAGPGSLVAMWGVCACRAGGGRQVGCLSVCLTDTSQSASLPPSHHPPSRRCVPPRFAPLAHPLTPHHPPRHSLVYIGQLIRVMSLGSSA